MELLLLLFYIHIGTGYWYIIHLLFILALGWNSLVRMGNSVPLCNFNYAHKCQIAFIYMYTIIAVI
jgi:hypothetical protein